MARVGAVRKFSSSSLSSLEEEEPEDEDEEEDEEAFLFLSDSSLIMDEVASVSSEGGGLEVEVVRRRAISDRRYCSVAGSASPGLVFLTVILEDTFSSLTSPVLGLKKSKHSLASFTGFCAPLYMVSESFSAGTATCTSPFCPIATYVSVSFATDLGLKSYFKVWKVVRSLLGVSQGNGGGTQA